jgi:Ca2+/Na+ antiporter
VAETVVTLMMAVIAFIDSNHLYLVKYTIFVSLALVCAMVVLLLHEGEGVDALIDLDLLFMCLVLIVQFQIRKRVRVMEFINRRTMNTLDLRIRDSEDMFNPLFMGPHIEPNPDIISAIDTYVRTVTVTAPLTICFHSPQVISQVIQDTMIETLRLHYQDEVRRVEHFMESRFIRYIILIIFSITMLRMMTLLPYTANQTIMWIVFSNFAAFSLWQIGSTYFERAQAFEELTQAVIIKESRIVFQCKEQSNDASI